MARAGIRAIDAVIAGRTFLAGECLTLADLTLFAFLAFGERVGQPFERDCRNIAAWFERMAERASALATASV